MKWTLRVYESPESSCVIHEEEIDAPNDISASSIAMKLVERDFPGCDWSLMGDSEIIQPVCKD